MKIKHTFFSSGLTINPKLFFTNVRIHSYVILVLGFVFSVLLPERSKAQTRLLVTIGTGEDDLRGGNRAFITLVLVDGTVLPEQVLSTGMAGGSTSTSRIYFSRSVSSHQIRAIRIRHDGNPRSGHPFDTYDNWNLRMLHVQITNFSYTPVTSLYNSANDTRAQNGLIERFTGAVRQIDLPIRAINLEPDFIIERINPASVTVRNIGPGPGRVTSLTYSRFGSTSIISTTLPSLRSMERSTIPWRFVTSGRVTFTILGVDAEGRPETVTSNNISSHVF